PIAVIARDSENAILCYIPRVRSHSLSWLDAEGLGNCGEFSALLFDTGREFGRPPDVDNLTCGFQSRRNEGVSRGHRSEISGDSFAQLARHAAWPEQAHEAIQRQRRVAGLDNGRNFRHG